ncbi:MAG: SatD family protein [Velocimicrobium sp.]
MFFLFFFKPYIAIIGDMKESKSIKDRNQIQEKLKTTLNEINGKYRNDISAKFIITLGDEFQGLLSSGANTMKIISEIERRMYPVKIRFGVGIGEITTDINHDMAIGADGPGYYKARDAIEYLKENEKRKQTGASDIRFEVDGKNQGTTIMLNTILSLLTVIKVAWSDRQREVIWDMLENQDSQVEVAKRLNIKQPTVQGILATGKYYAYKDALDTIEKALEEVRREDV